MKCIMCGHCCIDQALKVIDDPVLGFKEDNFIIKGIGVRCKHLKGDRPGNYQCSISDKGWFRYTECYKIFEMMTSKGCKIGDFIIGSRGGK